MIEVNCYGVHTTPSGVVYLHQEEATNALGLNERSPFRVRTLGRKPCNHQIPTRPVQIADTDWETFKAIRHDPLVETLLPLPREQKVTYFPGVQEEFLGELIQLSSPILPALYPAFAFSSAPKRLLQELGHSNIQPLVLLGMRPWLLKDLGPIIAVAQYHVRPLVLTGDTDVALPGIPRA